MTNNYKIFLAHVVALLITTTTFAQIPNSGFENWTSTGFPSYNEPNQWGTLNSSTSIISIYTVEKATGAGNFHSGTASMKLSTHYISFASQTAPGICVSSATINTSAHTIDGGFPYTQRPTHIAGWYKGTPAAHDSSSVELSLWKWDNVNHVQTPIGSAKFVNSANVSSFTQFVIPITYTSASTPDSALITLSSSNTDNPVDGSIFYVDDLAFLNCSAFTATSSSTNATCTSATGSATVTITGATSYDWSNSTHNATASNLAAGTYTVTAHDAGGCSATASVVVGSTTVTISPAAASTNTICTANSGTATASASAGTGPYTYLWSNNATTAIISNLPGATYQVTITDNNGCTGTASTTVNTTSTAITSTIASTTTSCVSNTGTATVTPTNGTANYTYHWNNNATTSGISNLGAGSYQVTITDANGCSGTASTSVTTPNGPSATKVVTDVTCHGLTNGAVDVTTTGGTGTITYQWNPGGGTNPDLTGLSAGTYNLTINDANNCSFTLTAVVTEPDAITAPAAITNVACHGNTTGSINVTTTGGTATYSYLWNNGGTTEDLFNLSAGNDTLVITDQNNCSAQFAYVVTQPTALNVTETHTNISCFGGNDGAITLTVSGGAPSYNYAWSGGGNTNLAAGAYSVIITDANSCTAQQSVTLTEPTALIAPVTVTDASSATATDGSITVNASGGTTPYTYTWNTGNGANLAPGTYNVTITDNNGCSTTATGTVGFGSGIKSIGLMNIKMYPNPASNQVVIETGSTDNKFTFSIYSLDGKLVEVRNINAAKTTVDVKELSVGFYTYQLKNNTTGAIGTGNLQIQR